jgi:hypothetical protein
MAAPNFNLAIFGPTGDKTTTEEALKAAVDAVTDAIWEKMHELLGRLTIDTLNPGGAANAYTASTSSAYEEATFASGNAFWIQIPTGATNTAASTLSINSEAALPIVDADGNPLTKGVLLSGRRYLVRKSGTPPGAISYYLLTGNADLLAMISTAGLIPTLNAAGSATAMTARLNGGLAASLPRANGAIYMVRAPATNTGAFTLSIEFETAVNVVDNDGLTPVAGEVRSGRFYMFRYSTTGPQYRLLTEVTKREINAIYAAIAASGGGGGSGEAEERAHIGAYLDGSTIRAVGDDDGVVATLGSLTAVSQPEGGRYASLIVNRPSLGANSLVGGYPGYGLLAPCSPQLLHVILVYGQSLAVGANSASSRVTLAQDWPTDALMFAGEDIDVRMGLVTAGTPDTLDPASLTGFQPLVALVGAGAGDRGETIAEGAARRLTRLAREMNIQHRTLFIVGGFGGTNYDGLKKGSAHWSNLMAGLARAKVLAEAQGWRVIVDGVLWKHGESDGGSSSYAADLAEAQGDFDDDVKAITGQAADIHMFVQQHSSFSSATNSVLGMATSHGSLIHVTGPDYPYADAYDPDFTHFSGPGYELIGERMALGFVDTKWRPTAVQSCLRITGASRSGTTVSVTYHVPTPPLAIDTTLVSNPGQWGFRFFGGVTEIPITAASVTDNGTGDNTGVIQLTLGSTPTGTQVLHYATALQADPKTLAAVPRGNVRDSAAETSQYDGRRLYRWAIHQSITL